MKKTVLLLNILLFWNIYAHAQTDFMNKVRVLYQKAPTEKKACEKLIKLMEANNPKQNPLLLGYKGSAIMMMANHVVNPFTKLSFFKEGRNMLEKAVKTERKNVELRFLRYAAQTNAPSFLGYDEHIAGDKEFLLQAGDSIDGNLEKFIRSQLNLNNTE